MREAAAHNENSGASGLKKVSRELFPTLGVPEELLGDGGPEYILESFQECLKT